MVSELATKKKKLKSVFVCTNYNKNSALFLEPRCIWRTLAVRTKERKM